VALRRKLREAGKERRDADVEWQDKLRESEEERSTAMCEMDRERKEAVRAMAAERNAAQKELTAQQKLVAEHTAALERSRGLSKNSLLSTVREQEAEISELSRRRANAMGATRELNLEKQRTKQQAAHTKKLQETIRSHWDAGTVELAEAATHWEAECDRLLLERSTLLDEIESMEETEIAPLYAIVHPKPPMDAGSYDARFRFMVMKLAGRAWRTSRSSATSTPSPSCTRSSTGRPTGRTPTCSTWRLSCRRRTPSCSRRRRSRGWSRPGRRSCCRASRTATRRSDTRRRTRRSPAGGGWTWSAFTPRCSRSPSPSNG